MSGPGPREIDPAVIELATRVYGMARDGDTAQLVAHLDAGVPVDLTNHNGDTLLMLAAYYTRTDTVEALLARGAATGRANDRGQTALAAAVFRQSADIVRLLLAAGADPDAGGPSARETAAFFALPEMTALLEARPDR